MIRRNTVKSLLLISLPLMMSFKAPDAKTVTGKVVGQHNEAITGAYVYVISGEEETLTVTDGGFQLKTWQPLPVTLVIEHGEFEQQRIVIRRYDKPLTIKLSSKKKH